MITKKQALDQTIEKWVLGDHPFAASLQDNEVVCIYNPEVNGGCAIGQFFGTAYRLDMEGESATRAILMSGLSFEDSSSDFWDTLQEAHDVMAKIALSRSQQEDSPQESSLQEVRDLGRLQETLLSLLEEVGE